jgi:hypothetical protein
MAIALPTDIQPAAASARLIDFGADMVPALGGAVQRVTRLGSRGALDVQLPPMKAEPDGRIWVSRLKRGKTERVLLPFPQLDLVIGNPGAPIVNGAVAGGTSLPFHGATGGYVFREGQFVSIIQGGRRYLHSIDAQAAASGSGIGVLAITPMLRVPLSDGASIEVNPPMIEGYIAGDEVSWSIDVARTIGLSFTIIEAE